MFFLRFRHWISRNLSGSSKVASFYHIFISFSRFVRVIYAPTLREISLLSISSIIRSHKNRKETKSHTLDSYDQVIKNAHKIHSTFFLDVVGSFGFLSFIVATCAILDTYIIIISCKHDVSASRQQAKSEMNRRRIEHNCGSNSEHKFSGSLVSI